MTLTQAGPLLGYLIGLWVGYRISREEIKNARVLGEFHGWIDGWHDAAKAFLLTED